MSPRFLLVDDHPIMRSGVMRLIQARWPQAECLEAGSLEEALRHAGAGVDAIVLDLSMPDASGLEALARLRRREDAPPVLVLSMHAEGAYAARALQEGAGGYLTKDRAGEELVVALERILAGGRFVTASLAEALAGLLVSGGDGPPHAALSRQEHRVLIALAEGRSVGDVAQQMHLSVKTVSTYRTRILEKLALKGNADLTRYCLAHGLIHL